MSASAHIALTLATGVEETEVPSSATRKSLRRMWNQLPRCQRNLIILGISLLCLTLFLLLPGEQLTPDHKFVPLRQRLLPDNAPDKGGGAAANSVDNKSVKSQLDEISAIEEPRIEESKQESHLLPQYTEYVGKATGFINNKSVKTTHYQHKQVDNDNVNMEEVLLQQNNNIEPPLEELQHVADNAENDRNLISEAVKHVDHLPGHVGINIDQYVDRFLLRTRCTTATFSWREQ